MVIALNKLHGILESFTEQKGILRLFVRLDSIFSLQGFQPSQNVAQNVESQSHLFVLLLEDSAFVSHLLHQPLQLGFKENNIISKKSIISFSGICQKIESPTLSPLCLTKSKAQSTLSVPFSA